MMISSPAATPKPAPAPAAGPAPAPTAPTAAPNAPTRAPDPAADAAAAKQAVVEALEKTSATDAINQVDDHLTKLAALSVGGGTPEGTQNAKVASALLTDASMLLQHAHVKAVEQLRAMATELHMRIMSSASGLAFLGGQVALAGQSKEPVKLADIIAGPAADTKAAMADVLTAIAPPAPKDGAAPAPAPKDGAAPAPAPAPRPAPGTLPHVTPGPGTGPGPHPA